MAFWLKRDEILWKGRWARVSVWEWLKHGFFGDVISCWSDGYPPESADRGYAHSGPRKELPTD